MKKKILIFLLAVTLFSISPFGLADILDNVETAYVYINSIVYDQKGNQQLDFSGKYELQDEYPNKYITAVNTSNPGGALGSNYSTYATLNNGADFKVELPVFPQDAQSIKVYYLYRKKVSDSGFWPWTWDDYHYEYQQKIDSVTPDKYGTTTLKIKLTSSQTVTMETIGKEITFKNQGQTTNYSWWDIFHWFGDDDQMPMYLQVVKIHNLKIPLAFPKLAIDGNRNIYTCLKKYTSISKKGSKYERDYYIEVYKNGTQKLFDVFVGKEYFRSTGTASFDRIGESLVPKISLACNPQGSRLYLHTNSPESKLYTYTIKDGKLDEQELGFVPEHMKVSTKNQGEDWIHYSFAHGLSVAETWGPEARIEDCERFELWNNKIYKTTDMMDIPNNNMQDAGLNEMGLKDVYGDVLTYYNPGEGFAYSNTGANTSAQFVLGNTPESWTAMGRRASMGVSMGVEVSKGKKLKIFERSNFKVSEYEFDASETSMRFTTKEGEDYRISINGKEVNIADVGGTPTVTETRRKKKWIIWPFWYKWEYYTVEVEDPVLNNPENFGLTAFYNISYVRLTDVPFEKIVYFAADGYGNKYSVRRTFGPYENWKTTGSVVRNGQRVRYYKRMTYFTLYKLDINGNETELFTSPNIGYSFYYRTESPWPPGSCGCKGVKLSDYIPIYEAIAEADLSTNGYVMPPKVIGTPIVDIKVTPTDAPKLQMLGITGELFMDVDENVLISETVAASNDVRFENHLGIEYGQKFLGNITTPEGKTPAPAGIINQHNPYMFIPNEYYYRYNIVDEVNKDEDGDGNLPDGAMEQEYAFDWPVTGGGFPSNAVLGRHLEFSQGRGDLQDPRLDSRYYVWAIRRLGILNPAKEGTDEYIVNKETPWTVINHGARDYVDNERAKRILTDTAMDFVPNEEFLNKTGTPEGFRFKPKDYRFDDGGIYEIMLAAGYRVIDWETMRENSDGGNLMFWWDEPEFIKEAAEPMKPDIERIVVRAFEPEDRENLLCAVIDGNTNTEPDYNSNKMMSNWQSFDDDGDGIADHAIVEMNEDFDHRWTVKLVQKDRYGNITSDNEEILFVPNRDQQQEIQDTIEPDEENKEQNLEIADKYSGIAFESSTGMKMHYEWKVQTMYEDQVFSYNYYNLTKDGNYDIDVPYVENNYQPWLSRIQEAGVEGDIYGQDGIRRSNFFLTNFNTPIVPLHYRITFTMYYTRIDYFDENGVFAYPLTDETGRVIGYDCKESVEKSEFYVDVFVKDTTLPQVVLKEPVMSGGTTGDPFPRDIIAYVSDNNPFDGMEEVQYQNLLGNLGKEDYISSGTKAHLVYPRRVDPNRKPYDVFDFEESYSSSIKYDDPAGWKWNRPSVEENNEFAYLAVTNALTGYDVPGVQRCSYEVTLYHDIEELKMLMPYDSVSDDLHGRYKYIVLAEDGMSNYYNNYRVQVPVYNSDGSVGYTTFSYPGDSNADLQMKNTLHKREDMDYITDNCYGVPKNMPEPGMVVGENAIISSLGLNDIYGGMAGSYYPDDEGDFKVYKKFEGTPENGYAGIQEGEINVIDNDPPEVYLRITNKRDVTIGYYFFDSNNVDGVGALEDKTSYPFRDETEFDEDIGELLALENESNRGALAVAVGGGDHDVYLDPQVFELVEGYPVEALDMKMDEVLPWYGYGFLAGGGTTGGIVDENDYQAMLYDLSEKLNIDTLILEEDFRVKIELAAVDNVRHDGRSLDLSLAGIFENGMLNYVSNDVNSAMYLTNLDQGTGNTPNASWSDIAGNGSADKIVDYFVWRESTRKDTEDEYLYVRVRDNAHNLPERCNEITFRIPVRIENVEMYERKIFERRKEDKLGE